jgi:preprotein translocase subunit SecA
MTNFLRKLFGASNEAEVRRLSRIVQQVEGFEPALQALSDRELQNKTEEFKGRLLKGESLDELLPEAYAVMREAIRRVLGQRLFPVQIMGGIVLHQGRIAEMRTGEGKTHTATLPVYLNALTGKGVHVVTVNDYLAKYQGEWMGKVYNFLGLSVGLILSQMDAETRRAAYASDVVYGTNNEFGFDYLRDNMVTRKEGLVQRGLHYAIVDEVDSILIDEARTPLIISGQGEESTEEYQRAKQFVERLREGVPPDEKDPDSVATGDYIKDEKQKTVNLTEEGVRKAEHFFGVENLSDVENTDLNHHIQAALRARALMRRDVDYVVKDGEVLIVDEFTGRLMIGRRYSDGLHQAIEAKEGVKVAHESKTLATITFQNYFRMYQKLSGMTGTAMTEEDEFKTIYKLDVVTIPTNRPMIRIDENDLVYRSERAKFQAVVEEIKEKNEKGQPVLVGTVSVDKSEKLSAMLERRGVKHVVLNAKHHEREAEIVAQAGKRGAVTIATNMAGRGTDILLGGNPEFLARREMLQQGFDEALIEEARGHSESKDEALLKARQAYNVLLGKHRAQTDGEHEEVVALGGLHIIGTERHESRRIDNQLRGRAGRQGDPGSSRFYIALEDDLMRLFGGERIAPMIERLGLEEDVPIEYGILSKQIENAQKRVESRNFDTRRHVLQYDDVMNAQREIIYGQRQQVLDGADVHEQLLKMVDELAEESVRAHCGLRDEDEWDLAGLSEAVQAEFDFKPDLSFVNASLPIEVLINQLRDDLRAHYEARCKKGEENGISVAETERNVLLRVVDQKWMDHIDDMDRLRDGIGLRAYGQRDPVVEYKMEGSNMFEEMVAAIQNDTVRIMFHLPLDRVVRRAEGPKTRLQLSRERAATPGKGGEGAKTPVRAAPKVGRNDPCPCGSGKKYKNCHGRTA